MPRKIKRQLSQHMCNAIRLSISLSLNNQLKMLSDSREEDQDLDKLMVALLQELYRKFERAEANDKGMVTIEFTKAQCLTIRLVFAGNTGVDTDTGNWLHMFCNEIEQKFSNTFYNKQNTLTNDTGIRGFIN